MSEPLSHDKVNLYVQNLNQDIDSDRLEREFSRFGSIVSARVMIQEGRSKGYGFVCFDSATAADNAIRGMNGYLFEGRRLYVAIADRQWPPSANYRFAPEEVNREYSNPHLRPILSRRPPRPVATLPTPPVPRRVYQCPWLESSQRLASQPSPFPMSANPQPGPSQYRGTCPRAITKRTHPPGDIVLTKEMLDAAPPYLHKQMIAEILYPLIQKRYTILATNITETLLELPTDELLHLLHDKEFLEKKAAEAAKLYYDSNMTEHVTATRE